MRIILHSTIMMIFVCLAMSAQAQNAPIEIILREELSFGEITIDNGTGRVRVGPGGNMTVRNGNIILGGGHERARYQVRGEPNTSLIVTLDEETLLTGPGEAMRMERFQVRPNNLSLNNNGRRNIRIGADLFMNRNQAGGAYSGTYNINVEYQ